MVLYKIIEEELSNPEIGSYTAFGLCAYNSSSNTTICKISDIFTEKDKAEKLVDACNNMQISIVHLPNIIEDILCDI